VSDTHFILVMGVSGAGKSVVGERLAASLGWAFLDADDLHPPSNREKMRAGVPLAEEDRSAWLDAVASAIRRYRRDGLDAVIACSALRRAHRRRLLQGARDVRLVYLRIDPALAVARVDNRVGHFMPASLVASQFRTLEEPAPGEAPVVVDAGLPPATAVAAIEGAIWPGGMKVKAK
jgi:gluconokinase